MKSFFSKILILGLVFSIISPSVSAHYGRYRNQSNNSSNYSRSYEAPVPQYNYNYNYNQQYPSYGNTVVSCTNLSSVSVSIGTLSNGVNISVSSNDYTLQNCIKNISWLSYFTRFGNSVTLSVANTTLGVQITATSYDTSTVSSLQNAGWAAIITGVSNSGGYGYNNYGSPYSTPNTYTQTYNYNQNPGYNYNNNYQYNYTPAPVYTYTPTYTNNYQAGSTFFWNTVYQISRSLSNISNGVQMTFTSPDYNTMRYLQGLSFSSLFSHMSGVSISRSDISGGTQITVTAGSTSSIQEIQNIGYALVYR